MHEIDDAREDQLRRRRRRQGRRKGAASRINGYADNDAQTYQCGVVVTISGESQLMPDCREENCMLNIVRYQPWSLMNRWHRELDQVFNQAPGGPEPVRTDGAAWMPAVDVYEESGRYLVRADIPGVTAKDIEVTAEGGVLTIRGERRANEPAEHNGFESLERVSGAFLRRFTLPEPAQEAGITANYANGVLEVVVPKAPRVEARRISVTVN